LPPWLPAQRSALGCSTPPCFSAGSLSPRRGDKPLNRDGVFGVVGPTVAGSMPPIRDRRSLPRRAPRITIRPAEITATRATAHCRAAQPEPHPTHGFHAVAFPQAAPRTLKSTAIREKSSLPKHATRVAPEIIQPLKFRDSMTRADAHKRRCHRPADRAVRPRRARPGRRPARGRRLLRWRGGGRS
jgi:hypothetical protein